MLDKVRQVPAALVFIGLLGIFVTFPIFILMLLVAALAEKDWLAELASNIIVAPAIFTLGVVAVTLILTTLGGCIYVVVKSVASIVRIDEKL